MILYLSVFELEYELGIISNNQEITPKSVWSKFFLRVEQQRMLFYSVNNQSFLVRYCSYGKRDVVLKERIQ